MSDVERATPGIYIALGANLGDRAGALRGAAAALISRGDIRILRQSTVMENEAVGGPAGQPRFLNAVMEVETQLRPHALLERLLQIERDFGRSRPAPPRDAEPNAPRTLDLDLLIYHDEIIDEPDLVVPHPRMWERPFVLKPLAEIADVERLRALLSHRRARGQPKTENTMFMDMTAPAFDWRSAYKLLIGVVTPRPIALVSTVNAAGQTNLAPFSFFNLVSGNPPVAMFCPSLNRNREHKHSYRNAMETREFVIAIVTEAIAEGMVRSAAELPYGESEFEFARLSPAPAKLVKAPLVAEAAANIECRLRQVVSLGDQPGAGQLVLGDIVALHVRDDALDASKSAIDPARLRTVGRLGGSGYCTVERPWNMETPKYSSGGSR